VRLSHTAIPTSAPQLGNTEPKERPLASGDQCQPCAWPSVFTFHDIMGIVVASAPCHLANFEFLAGFKRTMWLVLPDRLMCLRINFPMDFQDAFKPQCSTPYARQAMGFSQILLPSLYMALQRVLIVVISGCLPYSAPCRLCLTRFDTLHDRQALARDVRSSHFQGS
jgi:hypothetical protein